MPEAGAKILQDLRTALDESRHAAAQTQSAASESQRHCDELIRQREAALLDLARHELPDLSRQTVERTFADARGDLQAILDRQQRQVTELAGRLQRLAEPRDRAAEQLRTATNELNRAAARQAALQSQVAERLAANAEFQTLSRTAVETEAELARDEERVAEIQQEAAAKLPAYEQSRLLQYLLRRRYGTTDYAGAGLTRHFDQKIARLIDYPRAKTSYEFLRKTPELMQQELQRRRAEFEQVMETLEALERQTTKELGLPAAQAQVTELQRSHERATQAAQKSQEQFEKVEQELRELQESNGRFHAEAVGRLQRIFDQTQTDVLQAWAQATATPDDDALVAHIAALGEGVSLAQAELERQQAESRRRIGISEALDYVVRRFQQMELDSDRSSFETGFTIQPFVEQLERGVLDQRQLLDEIRRHQQFLSTPGERSVGEFFSHPRTQAILEAMVRTGGESVRRGAERTVRRRTGR